MTVNVEVGDQVSYIPDDCYWLDRDATGNLCFELILKKTGKRYFGPQAIKGRGPQKWLPAVALQRGNPLYHWPATIEAVNEDGSASLRIQHPFGNHQIFASKVHYHEGAAHSWYLGGEEKRFTPRQLGRFIVGSGPNVTSLGINFSPSISGTVGKSQSGSDYKGPGQAANIARSFPFISANSNTAAYGCDEFISYILSVSAGAAATVSLSSLTDFLLQTGVSLARVKAYRLNLMSLAQDATFGCSCTQLTVNGPVPPPVQSATAPSASGGSIAANTYYYVITSITAAGESTISNQQTAVVPGTSSGSVVLTWAQAPNATGYKIYRSTTTGVYSSPALITTIGSGSTLTYTDTAASASTGAPPSTNTAATLTTFPFNGPSGLSGKVLLNGDYDEYATAAPNGIVVGSNVDFYVYNNDAVHSAALQVTLCGGTS